MMRLPLLLVLSTFALLTGEAFASPALPPSVQFLPPISTIAGNGTGASSGDGGLATSAGLNYPRGVAVDPAGNVYIAEFSGNRVRKVDTAGNITTIAGNGSQGFGGDTGAATDAQLSNPSDVAIDAAGNVYIADYGNSRIRKVNAVTGIITTVAGGTLGCSGAGDGGPAIAAELCDPWGIDLDSAGNLYIADTDSNRVRKVDAVTGIITTVAGGSGGYGGDGGLATAASLASPFDVTMMQLAISTSPTLETI